ncbi:GDSL-type esterase/lipase family protein [Desulfosporosinus sp. FKA]|uniref:GDSL-type esterase/lipase family protein n=1 Tax=Desulfosporosinus sp. FKA TaxID=1969834 RepID=UPI000B498411|nr:GDSL-type esterase/lipase family protein [Desulfosporosinus sp. FKA]
MTSFRKYKYLKKPINWSLSLKATIVTGLLFLLIFGFFLPLRAGKANNPTQSPDSTAKETQTQTQTKTRTIPASAPSTQTIVQSESQSRSSLSTIVPSREIKADFSNVIFVGDSITYGFKKSHNTVVKQDHVYAKIGAHVYEGAKLLGDNSNIIRSRCNGSVDYVFLMFGANDFGYDMRSYQKWYKELIESTKKMFPESKIILQSVMPMKSTLDQPQRNLEPQKLNKIVKAVAAEEDVTYLDISKSIPNATNLLLSDGLHFKSELYPLWIAVIKNNVKQLL